MGSWTSAGSLAASIASAISYKNLSPYILEHILRLLSYRDRWNLFRFSLEIAARV